MEQLELFSQQQPDQASGDHLPKGQLELFDLADQVLACPEELVPWEVPEEPVSGVLERSDDASFQELLEYCREVYPEVLGAHFDVTRYEASFRTRSRKKGWRERMRALHKAQAVRTPYKD